MKRIIKQIGPFTGKTTNDRFLTLVRSIIGQQISTAASRTIFGRLEQGLKPEKICPDSLASHSIEQLRSIGISRQKATYLVELAAKVNSGEVELKSIGRLEDDVVIEQLIQVKGIGRWTAQMFLMFSLGRMDILPLDDLGIQNAIAIAYECQDRPTKQKIEKIAEPWRPYATIACWYLWASLDQKETS